MKLNIIKIGNSKGIRLPKVLLEQCNLKDTVDVEIKEGALVIKPFNDPREGWEEDFKRMAKTEDDKLLDSESFLLDSDEEDWQW